MISKTREHTSATTQVSKLTGNLESIQEEVETEHIDFATTGDDDTSRCKELISMQYPKSATTDDSRSQKDCTGSESSEESFVTDDDGNSSASQEEDEEYFIFAGIEGGLLIYALIHMLSVGA
ncbi:hypothetical protein EJB05_37965, partial [Eragrostis curvula]